MSFDTTHYAESVFHHSVPKKGEDTGFSFMLPMDAVAGLSDEVITLALKQAFQVVQKELMVSKCEKSYSGATAKVALLVDDKTFIANARDSIAMVVTKEGEIKVLVRHSADVHRIEARDTTITISGGRVFSCQFHEKIKGLCLTEVTEKKQKLRCSLQPTKGLGDKLFASAFPDWSISEVTIFEKTQRVILSSDGIEKQKDWHTRSKISSSMTPEKLCEVFGDLVCEVSVAEVPEKMTHRANYNNTWNDVYVVATESEACVVKVCDVFDGHFSAEVAQYAATYMGNAIYQQLALQQEKKQKHDFIAGYDERSSAMCLYTARARAKAAARRAAEVTP